MGIRLYADLPVSIMAALFMVSQEDMNEARTLCQNWHESVSGTMAESDAAWTAKTDHWLACEYDQWDMDGFGKWGMDILQDLFTLPTYTRDGDAYLEPVGEVLRETDPDAFHRVIDRLKARRRYRIDWELLRKECTRLVWS